MKTMILAFVLAVTSGYISSAQQAATFSIDSTTSIFGRTYYVFNQSNPGRLKEYLPYKYHHLHLIIIASHTSIHVHAA